MQIRLADYIADFLVSHGVTDMFMLTGGGALLRGLDKLIAGETKIPVLIAEKPLDCVVDGTGICLENDYLSKLGAKKYI